MRRPSAGDGDDENGESATLPLSLSPSLCLFSVSLLLLHTDRPVKQLQNPTHRHLQLSKMMMLVIKRMVSLMIMILRDEKNIS